MITIWKVHFRFDRTLFFRSHKAAEAYCDAWVYKAKSNETVRKCEVDGRVRYYFFGPVTTITITAEDCYTTSEEALAQEDK